jgi:5-methylcytosine-specific restriction endonuclease McrA
MGFMPRAWLFFGFERSPWEMDHIVAVVKGGGGCDISNLRVLCRPCHVAVTRELRRELAAKQRESK